jgi:hypothetical protein
MDDVLVLTPEQIAELKRLRAEQPEAHTRTVAALATHGMDSPEFLEADAAEGAIIRRVNELHRMGAKR